ncbi:EamA family transporter [Sneathiella chungangensis]|uniref:EamA family transporter n=1 Tax=Sneathiella chungangensis TaxID=1418234 RepID=A0A845MJL2_9PROT|nr:DMT family transporter [Sneathiella chungangensis]MZR24138.1 EamA family transporter [Sneathiella chungangensis]
MSLRAWVILLLLSFLWGGTFFFIELALVDFTPFTIVCLRVVIAALALYSYLKLKGEAIPHDLRLWGIFLVMGLLNNIIPFSLIVWGQTHITGSVASILNATTPLFAVILAHFLTTDETLNRHKLLGVLIGFGGVVVMMQPSMAEGFNFESIGQLAILGAALSYGFAGIWGKRLKGTSALVNAFGMLACSSFIMLPVALIVDEPFAASPDWISLSAVVALAIFGTALAYIFYFRLLALAGAVNLLLVTFLIPVTALLLGVGVLDEAIHPLALVGTAIIFAGLALIDGRILVFFRKPRKV